MTVDVYLLKQAAQSRKPCANKSGAQVPTLEGCLHVTCVLCSARDTNANPN